MSGDRHWAEIREEMGATSGRSVGLTFGPHLGRKNRGIHATPYRRHTVVLECKKLDDGPDACRLVLALAWNAGVPLLCPCAGGVDVRCRASVRRFRSR